MPTKASLNSMAANLINSAASWFGAVRTRIGLPNLRETNIEGYFELLRYARVKARGAGQAR
jgi:hypothetical protein